MRQQTSKGPKRQHTPVWQVIWSVRPRLKTYADILRPYEDITRQILQPALTSPKTKAVSVNTPKPSKYWARKVGVDLALLPLKLLHILVVGYKPKRKKPAIVWVGSLERR